MAILNLDFSQPAGTDITNLGFKASDNAGSATINGSGQLQFTGGAYNLFDNSEIISPPGSWSVFSFPGPGGAEASAGPKSTQIMPDGSTNGYIFNFAGYGSNTGAWSGINKIMSFSRGVTYTMSVWASVPSGTGNFRFYYFDYPNNTTVASSNIELTETPTRVSWTFTVPGTGNTGTNSTLGFAQGLAPFTPQVIFWGGQLERSPILTGYRNSTNRSPNSTFIYYDAGVSDHYVEIDILPTAIASHWPIVLRGDPSVRYDSSSAKGLTIGINSGTLRLGTAGGSTLRTFSSSTWPNGSFSQPFRIRAETAGDRVFIYVGAIGTKPDFLLTPGGYQVANTVWSPTSTLSGMGWRAWAGGTTTVLDNLEMGVSPAYITPADARSATKGSSPTSILPAPDSHNIPGWIEPFESNAGSLENRGFKTVGTGSIWAMDNYSAWGRRLSLNGSQINRLTQSNDLMNPAWAIIGGAQKLGYSPDKMFQGRADGTIIRFAPGVLSGIQSTPDATIPGSGSGGVVNNTFSCYIASVSGQTSVRLRAVGRNGNYSTQTSNDIVVNETPKRITFTATQNSSIIGAMGWHASLVQNSTLDSADVVVWGFQAEYGTTASELDAVGNNAFSKLWVKPVKTPRQYIEFDWLGGTSFAGGTEFIPAALRVMNASDFVGLLVDSPGRGGTMYLYSPGRFKQAISLNGTTYTGRIRLEIQGDKIQVFTGPMQGRDAKNFLTDYKTGEDLYPGYMTATDTGWSIQKGSSTGSYYAYGIVDNYESGDNIGPARFFLTPTDARSETRTDRIGRVDLAWTETFDAPAGTPLVDLGFEWKSTEFMGDPKKAVVGSNGRLTLLSSTKSSAIWTKSTISLNHFVECDITAYPLVNLEFPIVIRAATSEHFIGVWFDDNDLVIGNRYASTTTEYVRVPKSGLTLPFRLRLEVKGHFVYAFRGAAGLSANVRIGSSTGYRIDPNATPLLMTSNRSGVGRINDIQADNISDNYIAGIAMIASKITTPRGTRSETFTENPFVDGISRPIGRKGRSETRQGRMEDDTITFEQFVTPVTGLSETRADIMPIQPEAISYTRSDVAVVTTDRVVIEKTASETRADEWHEPSTVDVVSVGRSETRADVIPKASVHVFIYSDPKQVPGWVDRPKYIRVGRSQTRADVMPLNGLIEIDIQDAKSRTRADQVTVKPQRFVNGIEARSSTIAEATFAAVVFVINPHDARSETRADGPTPEQNETYRPWLFT